MMIIISDTNILSSLAAGDSFDLLFHLFKRSQICVPLAVQDELQVGVDNGKAHLSQVLQAIDDKRLKLLPLSPSEVHVSQSLPSKLHAGECEAIALAQSRKAPLLSNDKRAIHYSRKQGIRVLALTDILRLLWIRHIVSQKEVKKIIQAMETVEKLKLKKTQLDQILAPPFRRKRSRRK